MNVNRRGTAVIALGIFLVCCTDAYALNPSLDISQYAHTTWKTRDGFVKGIVLSIAQTPDGYLWIGTDSGLFRFDGVRAVPLRLPAARTDRVVRGASKLVGARDGTLWISSTPGLSSWKDGKLTDYPEFVDSYIALLKSRDGDVWMASADPTSRRLCVGKNGALQCADVDSDFAGGMFEDSKSNLWVGLSAGLVRWKPGAPRSFPLPQQLNGYLGLAEEGGALLVSTPEGIARFVDGHTAIVHPSPPQVRPLTATALLRDRDGGLWMGTPGRGLVHVHDGRTEVFTRAEGLSGDFVLAVLEDREGTIWIATTNGVDRFRDVVVPTYSIQQGLSNETVTAVLAAKNDAIWIGTLDGLNRLEHDQLTIYREQHRSTRPGIREVVTRGFPERSNSLLQDTRGRIWISDRHHIGYLKRDRFVPVADTAGLAVSSMVEDHQGDIWIAASEALEHVRGDRLVAQIPWTTLGAPRAAAVALAIDPRAGGLWLGLFSGGLRQFADGRLQASYSSAEGLGRGSVFSLRATVDGTVWASTEGGLSRVRGRHIATVNTGNGLPCDGVHWSIEDSGGSVWLSTACGLLRVPRTELEARADAIDSGESARSAMTFTLFDSSNGVALRSRPSLYDSQVSRSTDGRIWFSTTDGVSVVDPRHLQGNSLPPPVHVEQLIANRTPYDAVSGLRLPPLIRDLQVDYTALSLVAPEKNRFKVKLEGWDRDWQDVGNRRQAFYNNLPPRSYTFRVIASNNSGVWNETGATYEFAIAPAYYQTTWFRTLVVAGALFVLWALYQYRVRQLAHVFEARLDERINERTRVARELHDTLLQTFHGILFRFQAAVNMLPERPVEAKEKFESTIDRAAQALTEGRDAIQDLRASTVVTNDLAVAITTLGEELAASGVNGHDTVVHVAVQGTSRDLHPILRDDIYRIAGEALRNAFRHAHAHRIEVEITYDDRQFRLQVRDDGKGMDPAVLADQRRGHFGLPGMRERAELVGGRLDVWSEVGAGTEIDLTIPAAKAYAAARAGRRTWWFAKRTGTDS